MIDLTIYKNILTSTLELFVLKGGIMNIVKKFLLDDYPNGDSSIVRTINDIASKYPWMTSTDDYSGYMIDDGDYALLKNHQHLIDFTKLNQKYAIVLLTLLCQDFLNCHVYPHHCGSTKYGWYVLSNNFLKAVYNYPLNDLTTQQQKLYTFIVMNKLMR